jgi:hypothetical protein
MHSFTAHFMLRLMPGLHIRMQAFAASLLTPVQVNQ